MSAVHLPRKSAAGSDIAQQLQSIYWPVPIVVLDVEAGARGDELFDHARAAVCCAQEERSVPSERAGCWFKWRISIAVGTMAGLDRANPLKSAPRTAITQRHTRQPETVWIADGTQTVPARIRGMDVRALRQQRFHALRVALTRRVVQRCALGRAAQAKKRRWYVRPTIDKQ